MTFETARKNLAKLADGKFRSISYELTEFSSGKAEVSCTVYIDGFNHFFAPTWEGALNKLKQAMEPKPTEIDPEEAPKTDGLDL